MRILGLIISLAIMAWLAYFMINRVMTPDESMGIKEGDTIIDTIDYAEDAVGAANLQACLRLCGIDFEKQATCEAECKKNNK